MIGAGSGVGFGDACASTQASGSAAKVEETIEQQLCLVKTRLEFSSGLGRRLASPVTALATYIDTCKKLIDSDLGPEQTIEKLQQLLSLASADADRSVELMHHWKGMMRSVPGRKLQVRPEQLLLDCLDSVSSEFIELGVELRRHVDADLPSLLVDPYGFLEVTRNVLGCFASVIQGNSNHAMQIFASCIGCDGYIGFRLMLTTERSIGSGNEAKSVGGKGFYSPGLKGNDVLLHENAWGEQVRALGGHAWRGKAANALVDFGFYFPPQIQEGNGS